MIHIINNIPEITLTERSITGDNEFFRSNLSLLKQFDGIYHLNINIDGDVSKAPPVYRVSFKCPAVNIHGAWRPAVQNMEDGFNRSLAVDWDGWDGHPAANTVSAPVSSLYDVSGMNRITVAYSDLLGPVDMKLAINEEGAEIHLLLTLFKRTTLRFANYSQRIRIDTRTIPYFTALKDVSKWWETLPGTTPAQVPFYAKLPMYSTWYSYHQTVNAADVEAQCKIAKELGCESVIVDDGWQLSGVDNGYAHTGDWEPKREKIENMREHVEKAHDLGMKYLLWYSVPFVGIKSQVWDRFKDKLIDMWEAKGAGVLDPRFPDVREYLINKYETAVKEWDLDGFKLDFVDCFNGNEGKEIQYGNGRDFNSVQEAVDKLLSDVMLRLKVLKPDIMIEFRQPYHGPLMRKYGNMIRAWDCVNDALENRVRTIDIRLLNGTTPAHSDMIIWNTEDTVESAALQLINVLFSVPQISVCLDKIPEVHLKMLKFWLGFFKEHLDVLQEGELIPLEPQLLYPIVFAENKSKRIAVVYSDHVIKSRVNIPEKFIIVNGKYTQEVIVDIEEDLGNCEIDVFNCIGEVVDVFEMNLQKNIHRINIPESGVAIIKKNKGKAGVDKCF